MNKISSIDKSKEKRLHCSKGKLLSPPPLQWYKDSNFTKSLVALLSLIRRNMQSQYPIIDSMSLWKYLTNMMEKSSYGQDILIAFEQSYRHSLVSMARKQWKLTMAEHNMSSDPK